MNRKPQWLIGFLLVALGFNLALGLGAIYQRAYAAETATYLPIIQREQTAQIATTIDTIYGGDNSFISSARSPAGCNFFAFIDRDSGNIIRVMRQTSRTLVEDVPLPPIVNAFVVVSPQFVPPGEKHADVSIMITDALELYYTTRQPDNPSGPFNVMHLRMTIPPCTGPM